MAFEIIEAWLIINKFILIKRLYVYLNVKSNMRPAPQLEQKNVPRRVNLDKWPLTLRDSGLIYAHLTGILACLMTLAFKRLWNKHHNRRSRQTTLGIYRRTLWANP